MTEMEALHLHPQRYQTVEHHGADGDEHRFHDSPVEIAGSDEVARGREPGDGERQCHHRPEPEGVQLAVPAARRAGAQALHHRAAGPEEAHEEYGERNHRQTESETRQALAVGERRVIQSVQGRDERERHEDRGEPAQTARGRAEGRLVPAEVPDRHAVPVEQPCKRGKRKQELGHRQQRVAERQRKGLAIGCMGEHRARGPEHHRDGQRERERDRERCEGVADPVALVGHGGRRERHERAQ